MKTHLRRASFSLSMSTLALIGCSDGSGGGHAVRPVVRRSCSEIHILRPQFGADRQGRAEVPPDAARKLAAQQAGASSAPGRAYGIFPPR